MKLVFKGKEQTEEGIKNIDYVVDSAIIHGGYICLISPDQTKFRLKMDDSGALETFKGNLLKSINLNSEFQTSTTSSTYVIMNGMSRTIVDAGKYLVLFSSSGFGNKNNQDMKYVLYQNGVIIQRTERDMSFSKSQSGDIRQAMIVMDVVEVQANDVLNIRFKTNKGVFYVNERVLVFLKID